MAAMVQTLPAQTDPVTMLGRPSSSGSYPSPSSPGPARNQPSRYHNLSTTGYRGMPATGPVAPYAFKSTPQLNTTSLPPRALGTSAGRTASATRISLAPTNATAAALSSQPASPTKSLPPDHPGRPLSLGLPEIPLTGSLMGPSPVLYPPLPLTQTFQPVVSKPSPDRYRRNVRRPDGESGPNRIAVTTASSTASPATVGSLYSHPSKNNSSPTLSTQHSPRNSMHVNKTAPNLSSADDMQLGRSQGPDLAARYRRRSFGGIETAGLIHSSDAQDVASPHPNTFIGPLGSPSANPPATVPSSQRPSVHKHSSSSESVNSARSARSSRPTSARTEQPPSNAPASFPTTAVPRLAEPRYPASSRFADPSARQPSPLSRPVDLHDANAADRPREPARSPLPSPTVQPGAATSPAADHLTALQVKDSKKSKSRLRRAFSFGSTTELRRFATQSEHARDISERMPANVKRNSKYEDELEPEQARIAEKQEAGGLGESIYSGQGQFFTGSTDNLSISSTASSASVMLRKMGHGVKKGTRSLVGLFRPKSVVGVPAADGPLEPATPAQVSMVTVEAEREKVNVNADPHAQAGGGTGFPKLERNSIDNKLSFDSGTVSTDSRSRRSIVGGEKERSEVLAAVKKGILKRTDSNQPSPRLKTYDFKVPDFNLPHIPHMNDSPKSSAPSTPADDPPRSGHRRTDSIAIEGHDPDDYFSSMARFASLDSKSSPMTPNGLIRNISFSPRLQFHDTWPSAEYDRRGEIATCNRLTPMLAQQIKEELNTFKMEMEVHESSKVYTHFF